jgi:phosphoglycerol transferase MdoB-like AlkP superfamily enzyme
MVSWLIEATCQPRPAHVWRRPWQAVSIHVGIWLLVFAAELALFRRAWFAAANVDALFLALLLINNAKVHSLREPFVYQDFDYITDALRHPRLYLPFLGLWRLLIAIAAIVGVVVVGLMLESRMTAVLSRQEFLVGLASLALLAAGLLLAARPTLPRTQHDPEADLKGLGLLAFWWRYAADERQTPTARALHPLYSRNASMDRDADSDAPDLAACPDLIAIQSESFFDARRLCAAVNPRVLAHFDALKAAAAAHGTLQVAAWGANTVRTEFAFLSGLDPASLGVHRFNPYRRLAQLGVANMASYLKGRGYRTVCVHPYPQSFSRRDVVYPALGFDEFVDIRGFVGAARAGMFVSDLAIAEKIQELLAVAGRGPLFLFAITMENHGPLHLETVEPGDIENLYTESPPSDCEDLTVYLRHLSNADRMLGALRQSLEAAPRAAGMCFFGDHVPIMPKVYAALGSPDGRTDYLIWRKGRECGAGGWGNQSAAPMSVENLGEQFLRHLGMASIARPASACSRP